MDAVRDSVGIAFPFAAGIALSIWTISFISPYSGGLVASCSFICVSIIALLLTGHNDRIKPSGKRILIGMMFFATGMFSAFTENIWSGTDTGSYIGPVSEAADRCSRSLKDLIDRINYSDAETSALVKALLTGDKSGLGRATGDAFRRSGASHLLALSGMHLGIIYMIINKLLSGIGHGRKASAARYIIIIVCSGFFTLMTGATPSLVRAFLFILLNETASVTGRSGDSIHSLCMALVIQLAFRPETISSAGFQLSYLAMCGILFLFPVLKRWYPSDDRRGIMGRIWDGAALSISCQAFTAPLVWYYFGTFPQYFILTNLLAIPLMTLIMTGSVAVVFLSAAGICPDFLITANETAVRALRFTLETISSL